MKVLIVIDMQTDFIDGSLGTPEAIQIVPYVQKKIMEYKENGDRVLFTRDTHSEDYLATQEGKNLPVEHCIRNTAGWQIAGELNLQDSVVFDKPSFGSVRLAEYVREHYPQSEIELVGLCTDICVISNAMIIKAFLPESQIQVDAKGCAGVTVESHKNALQAMKMCQIRIVNEEID